MKENILEVLVYLFEYYMDKDVYPEQDQDTLRTELNAAGFPDGEVIRAFEWLESLAVQQEQSDGRPLHTQLPMRIYTDKEMKHLDADCRGFVLYLEQAGVLDLYSREIVVDRCMALEGEPITMDQLKWVILMVLFHNPEQESAYFWMEDLVYNEMPTRFH